MMYTKKDVIVWEDDERLEGLQEGDEIWTESNYRWLVEKANNNCRPDQFVCVDATCDNTFVFKASYGISAAPFMIIKKKAGGKKKIVPFDFSLKEDRDAVIGKRVFHKTLGFDGYITNFMKFKSSWQAEGFSASDLLINGIFVDTGKPVGKEVGE